MPGFAIMVAYGKFDLVVPPEGKSGVMGDFLNIVFLLKFVPEYFILSHDFKYHKCLTWLPSAVFSLQHIELSPMLFNGI